ncbi:MAG: DinB family protein [Planctomycetota bacterium]|nr:DinB family protein [Planctomycetota bacterium]
MDLAGLRRHLAANVRTLAALVEGLTPDEASARTRPGRWSSHEVLHHLVYEEREDFRKRIEWTLFHPGEDWPPIDPAGWIEEQRYPDESVEATLAAFATERAASIAWLERLEADGQLDLGASNTHPLAGTMTVRDLLASWLAHDHLHLRQLVRNAYERGGHLTGVAETPYAGDW